MHRMFRGAARVAAIAALTVGSGALVAVPPAIADIGADIDLMCSGKAGTHQVALRIDSTVPTSGTVGQPVQLGTIKVDVGLPPELVKEVEPAPSVEASAPPVTGVTPSSATAPALGGVAEIQVAVRGSGGERRGGWPAFALAAAPPRGDGAVHLTGSGVAPPVVPESPGGLSWSAGAVGLSLVPDDTAGQDSEELALRCVAEKETVLGTVDVKRGNGTAVPGASSASPRQAAAPQHLCETIPAGGEDPRYAINYDDPKLAGIYGSPRTPDGTFDFPDTGIMMCIKATGFFNLRKAENAAPVAVETNARVPIESSQGNPIFGPNWSELRGYSVNRTYPASATLLGFGFMPTRAEATAVQVPAPSSGPADPVTGNLRILQSQALDIPGPTVENHEIRAASYIRIKAGQTEVNGVPLDLGDKCMTSSTLLSATGFMGNLRTGTTQYDQGQTLIAEDFTIPAFSGCGVDEDLSPILTASVSGAGNYANLESGRWCLLSAGGHNCVDGAGELPRTFTVYPGGAVTAVAKPFTLTNGDAEFRCESATMRFTMDRGRWQSRFRLGKGDMSLADCKVKASDGAVHQVEGDVTQDGALWMNMIINETSGNPEMRINGVLLNAAVDLGGGQKCTLRISDSLGTFFAITDERPGEMHGTYENGIFSAQTSELKPSVKSTCQIPGFTEPGVKFASVKGDFAFDPVQQITTP